MYKFQGNLGQISHDIGRNKPSQEEKDQHSHESIRNVQDEKK